MIENQVDCLVFGSHPDDIELCCGGTVAKLVKEGHKVVLVDMSRGETGTRGDAVTRRHESDCACAKLGAIKRENLELPDGSIELTPDSELKMIWLIRKYRPKMIIMPPPYERHPDHENSAKIIRVANFKAGLGKIRTEEKGFPQEKYRCYKLFCYMQAYDFPQNPHFYVDITDVHELKIESIKCHRTQVFVPGESKEEGPKTLLFTPDFLEKIIARDRYFGGLIQTKYAEAFWSLESVGVSSISAFL